MLLSQLLSSLVKFQVVHRSDVDVTSITADSRQVLPGALFIAIRGYTVDGHQFLREAVNKGAHALLVETPDENLPVPQIVVPDSRRASAILADRFYGHPSLKLSMIGVTGTNGKTTVTHLIETILQNRGLKTGLLGTIGKRINGKTDAVVNTTPEAVELQGVLAEMVEAGCEYGIMEVSSHALELGRVAGTRYHIAVFTNLTQDHLDFHGTMENYRHAKGKLFARLGNTYGNDKQSSAYAVINADDDAASVYLSETVMETITYGIDNMADVRASNIRITAGGAHFHLSTFRGEADVHLRLTGRFNIYNALAAVSVGLIEDIELPDIVSSLEAVGGIPGRFELVEAGQPFSIVVDYSHTPDSLLNALQTVHEFAEQKVITVVGCGGDRDRTKRPIMAEVALNHSDVVILTSDNPRTEDPERILDDMEAGVQNSGKVYERVTDRKQAIERAVAIAKPGDVILIAGKGHEDYQIIGKTKHHFDDREVAAEAVRNLSW